MLTVGNGDIDDSKKQNCINDMMYFKIPSVIGLF